MIADQVVHTVERQLQRLQSLPEHPKRAALAKLRKGIGRMPGDMPELWGSFLQGMPPELQSRDGTPSRGEWAVYLTLTLFALHQQGQERSMNQPGISLGAAVRKLADLDRDKKNKDAEPDESGVFRRFSALLTANSAEEISPSPAGDHSAAAPGSPAAGLSHAGPGSVLAASFKLRPARAPALGTGLLHHSRSG